MSPPPHPLGLHCTDLEGAGVPGAGWSVLHGASARPGLRAKPTLAQTRRQEKAEARQEGSGGRRLLWKVRRFLTCDQIKQMPPRNSVSGGAGQGQPVRVGGDVSRTLSLPPPALNCPVLLRGADAPVSLLRPGPIPQHGILTVARAPAEVAQGPGLRPAGATVTRLPAEAGGGARGSSTYRR